MEAVSKGARLVIEEKRQQQQTGETLPEVIGVVVSELFPDRATKGNPYLTKMIDSHSMLHRIDQLTRLARYFVILPGTMGTLQELVSVWMSAVLHPKEKLAPVIIAFRDPWEACMRQVAESLNFPSWQIDKIQFVDTPEQVMEIVRAEEALLKE
ncbi:ribosomal protein L32-like protein [Angomonas deanei]|nr:ribosomal protein L32-like protein [Angomonas deanei]|eukprot:EPY41750.1 ribosomal protein L32-like protein [Angomonas deanei]